MDGGDKAVDGGGKAVDGGGKTMGRRGKKIAESVLNEERTTCGYFLIDGRPHCVDAFPPPSLLPNPCWIRPLSRGERRR